jgi:hypothetical protein
MATAKRQLSLVAPTIEIAADARKPITVDLVGVRYTLMPPKSAYSLRMAMRAQGAGEDVMQLINILDDWCAAAFGRTVASEVLARLDNADDLLDYSHLMQLMAKTAEIGTANPTS